jgi:NAD(P)H-dependent flavin oxidoreductase YrpB (nitropropane dioxygenase family)
VLDAVKVPVVAAGGFADGRGLAAALAFGACGIAMGSRFLITRESPLPQITKDRYLRARTDDIIVSTKVDGMPQRMIVNEALARIERSGKFGLWRRAIESGLAMKRQSGASWLDLYRAAKGMTGHGGLSLPQAMMAASAPMLIQRAVVEGDPAGGIMATGLVAGRLSDLPSCAELLGAIEKDARAAITALTQTQPAEEATA